MAIVIRELQNIVGLEVTKVYLGFLSRTIKPTVFDVINTSKGASLSSALYLEEKDAISPWWATADVPLSAVDTEVVLSSAVAEDVVAASPNGVCGKR